MAKANANTHLTLEERKIIEIGIRNGSTKTAISDTLGKDNSTIGKEIKLHRELSHKCHMPLECKGYRKCVHGRQCTQECPDYVPFTCQRRDRSPGACNGCSKWSTCRFNKYTYNAEKAHSAYRYTLVDAREGVNLTAAEAKEMAETVAPLLGKGMSPYAILQVRPDINVCEKTLYNYIEGGVLHEVGDIAAIDLRRQVGRRLPKKKSSKLKKRQDRQYLSGRSYKDYLAYMEEHPAANVVEMDTVYNNESEGPFVQTFKFRCCGVVFAIIHWEKTAAEMTAGVRTLESALGRDVFGKYVHVLLTDRGAEFSSPEPMEKRDDGTTRTRVFYCDPMQSGQKGSLENSHELLRYICPKGTDLKELGLTGQEALNEAIRNIDSYPVESFGGKCPLDVAEFMFNDLYVALSSYGIRRVEKDEVVLKPYLLKKFRCTASASD